jgi:hypothetical protein
MSSSSSSVTPDAASPTVELTLEYSGDGSYILMDSYSIQIKGVNYQITMKRIGGGKDIFWLYLKQGKETLGDTWFDTSIHVYAIGASNMENKMGKAIPYTSSDRKAGRIPVGTILFDAIRRFASLNGVKQISLNSVAAPTSQFYERMGMARRSNGSFIYTINLGAEKGSTRKYRTARSRSSRRNSRTRRN